MSVQEYLEKHRLSMRIEDAVNAAVRAKSTDPVIFIVHALFSPSCCFVSRGFSLPFFRKLSRSMPAESKGERSGSTAGQIR
jgi:hypothetical protein